MSKKVLIVAAHPDDEILGCGGTIKKLISSGNCIYVLFLTDGESSRNNKDIKKNINNRKECAKNALNFLGCQELFFANFHDNQMDTIRLLKIVQYLEGIIKEIEPEIIYTHSPCDLNIDHAKTHQAVITACRPLQTSPVKQIFTFEISSSSEWNFSQNEYLFKPNWFEDISPFIDDKIKAINFYQNELRSWPHPRSVKAIKNLSIYRGATIAVDYAEAFNLIFNKS